ncbi:MAG: helix-turn-helix domain-containing protein, partial [Armatimonadetes bacterium]|nr:helix-turn-helix domain-containing protein [Armatimonadota bacterium]
MRKESDYTVSSGNVFEDLGLPNPELHMAKANLVSQIGRAIWEMNLTQAQAAKLMGIGQPKVSALLRGDFQGYSVDRLL